MNFVSFGSVSHLFLIFSLEFFIYLENGRRQLFHDQVSTKHIRRTMDRTRDLLNIIRTVLAGPADDQKYWSWQLNSWLCVRACVRECVRAWEREREREREREIDRGERERKREREREREKKHFYCYLTASLVGCLGNLDCMCYTELCYNAKCTYYRTNS